MTRTEKGLKNLKYAMLLQGVSILVSFLTRRVFIRMLAREYLGLNGVFSSVLSMLNLTEMGIGTAIVYSLYKPLAEHDQGQVAALMALYRRAYWTIGAIVGLLGAMLTPFLPVLIQDLPDIPHIEWIYLLFVLDTSLSYFFSYRQSLLVADQRQYIREMGQLITQVLLQLAQILFLWLTGNYFVYLGLGIGAGLIRNLVLSKIAGRLYPYIDAGRKERLKPETSATIVRNVKAMITHKIGGVMVFGTDNLLISFFDGIVNVGLYSNYCMVTRTLSSTYSKAFSSLTASIGNLGATADAGQVLPMFYRLNFAGSWLYGFSTVCLIVLLNPFIELWLGADLLFSQVNVCLIALNFYLRGMRQATLTFRSAYGVYWEDRYRPIAEAAVNLAASIVLAVPLGVTGIFLGTSISTITTCLWEEPLILFRYRLKAPVWPYFQRYAINTAVTILTTAVVWVICSALPGAGLPQFIAKMAVCAVVGNLGFLLMYHRREELRYFARLMMDQLAKRRGKRGP